MAFDGDGNGTARRQRATKTTARIELKRWMADGRCQMAVSAVADIAAVVLRPPSLTIFSIFSTAAALRHRPAAVVVAVILRQTSSVVVVMRRCAS
jgi:hypothetical protein